MKIAIITGASSGIGTEFFKTVSSRYSWLDEIWLVARRADRLTELSKTASVKVRPVPCDLTDENALSAFEQLLNLEKPDVRILINNAGFGRLGFVNELPYFDQIRMITLNNSAVTALCAMCVKYMTEGSFIINVASIAAFAPNPRMTVYSATKAYILSFTKSLREELKSKNINALAVCPGPMRTEFLDVAGISGGKSKTFETLPYCDPKKTAENAIKYAAKGRAVYTPRVFYKFYRILAKLVPHNVVMKFSKT